MQLPVIYQKLKDKKVSDSLGVSDKTYINIFLKLIHTE